MHSQDNKINYRIIVSALIAVILAILIAFYYSYSQSKNRIVYFQEQVSLLEKDLTLLQVEVDHLGGLNEVSTIELDESKFKIQNLLDSIGQLTFTVEKYKEYKREIRILEAEFDTIKYKYAKLSQTNSNLESKYAKTNQRIKELQKKSEALAQAEEKWRATNKALSKRLKEKSYMILKNTEAIGFSSRGASRPIKTNKASTISKLRGCVTVQADPSIKGENKVLYFQFLDPNKAVISHAATTVTVNGNVYSKRIDFGYTGTENIVCDAVSVPEGSLIEGIYTLNVFEEEKLLSSTEFELK